jgi:hypothetical protein
MRTVVDPHRGCGWRKPGALYLRTEPGPMASCCRLPHPLTVCPCCGAGVKFCRGWTWVSPRLLFEVRAAARRKPFVPPCTGAPTCALADPPARAGLLWIGAEFYTPDEWIAESKRFGVSRRIQSVPHDFILGKTWVLVASVDACRDPATKKPAPGIFQAFRPTAVEYVVRGDETPEQIAKLEKRGITPVKVVRDGHFPNL